MIKICNLSVNTEELMACGRSPHFYLFHNSEDITRPISSLEICFVSVIHGFVFWYFNSEPSVGYGVQGGKGFPVLCKLGCRSPAEA